MAIIGLATKGASLLATADMLGLELDASSGLQWAARLLRVGNALGGHARGVDRRALDEMVELARSRAPERSGRLKLGITGTQEGELFVFKAEARRDSGGTEDYAPFVERGTRPGQRGKRYSRITDYESARGIGRRARRTHPGTEAQPFFYSSAREVLERRNIELGAALTRATAEAVEE
jgi:hypothetical protein